MKTGEKIRQLRELRNMSQGRLAVAIGRFQARVSKWEQGMGQPNPGDLFRLSLALRVPLVYLCDDSLERPEDATEAMPPLEGAHRVWPIVQSLGVERSLARLLGMPEPTTPPRPLAPELPEAPLPEPPKAPGYADTLKTVRMPRRKGDGANNSHGEPATPTPAPEPPPAPSPGKAPAESRRGPKKKPGAR